MSVVLNYITNAAFKNDSFTVLGRQWQCEVTVSQTAIILHSQIMSINFHFFFACDICDFLCHRENPSKISSPIKEHTPHVAKSAHCFCQLSFQWEVFRSSQHFFLCAIDLEEISRTRKKGAINNIE